MAALFYLTTMQDAIAIRQKRSDHSQMPVLSAALACRFAESRSL